MAKSILSPTRLTSIIDDQIVLGEVLRTWIFKSKDEFHITLTRRFEGGQYEPDQMNVFKRKKK